MPCGKKLFDWGTIAVFALIIFLPLLGAAGLLFDVWHCQSPPGHPERRERIPSVLPSMDGLAAAPSAIENYFSKTFCFRDSLLLVNNYSRYKLLGVSPQSEKVIVGAGGWLFLGNAYERIVDQHLGRCPAPDDHIKLIVDNEKKKEAWLRRRGIKFISVIAPDKYSIYPEHLPGWVRRKVDCSNTDAIVKALKTAGANIIDLRPVLREQKARHGDALYGKTDTHWSNLGAYHAYQDIMSALAAELGQLKRINMAGLIIKPTKGGFDLAAMIGLNDYLPDSLAVLQYDAPFSGFTVRQFDDKQSKFVEAKGPSDFDDSLVSNDNALNKQTVLCLCDSFFGALTPLFNQTFSRVAYTHYAHEYAGNIDRLILELRPDVVVLERVERVVVWNGVRLYPIMEQPNLTSLECQNIWPHLADLAFSLRGGDIGLVNGKIFSAPLVGAGHKNIIVRLDVSAQSGGSLKCVTVVNSSDKQSTVAENTLVLKPGRQVLFREVINHGDADVLRLEPSSDAGKIVVHDLVVKAFHEADLPALYRRISPADYR